MEFTTERLILRPWKDEDAESLFEYEKTLKSDRSRDGRFTQV